MGSLVLSSLTNRSLKFNNEIKVVNLCFTLVRKGKKEMKS